MVRLKVEDLKFSHGKKPILHGLDVEIRDGEVIGILGQNGSGKTTLLNCINTTYRQSKGSVAVADFSADVLDSPRELEDMMDIRSFTDTERSRIIATVEQNSFMSFPFTVMDTVRMGRYSRAGILDESDEEETEKVLSCLEETGILDFASRNVSELSGGEWRRVMIAQALAQEPEVLLLDEPTLHLDINHQFELMDLCRRIVARGGILVAIVTHDLQLAARYCDRVIVMREGEIIANGPAKEVITEDMIAEVFGMRSRVAWDDEIGGMSVFLIDRIYN
ncbi:MAG: ABC transporter ATP-binding protein [Candidatus Methanomethylophilaceae archaeon]|nr:ABC transporter ATP-binding protein [Candidatus Methanomethylophilaceae archaeon]